MSSKENLLKYGDCIILSCNQGFLQSNGFTKTSCFIQVGYNKSLTYTRNLREFVFQVQPRMNYDAYKEYSAFKRYYNKALGAGSEGGIGKKQGVSIQDKLRMQQLNKKLAEEISMNKKIMERRKGELVEYGNEVQLYHYDSQSFLEGSKNCADLDKSCNMVKLNSQGSKLVVFVVEPRYKYRNQGQSVNYQDVVVFRNIKNNQYLHISTQSILMPKQRAKVEPDKWKPIKPEDPKVEPKEFKGIIQPMIDRRMLVDEFAALYEVNTSSLRSNFTIRPYRSFEDDSNDQIIKGGQVVRFQHSESGGWICSDDIDYTGDNLAEVFLWNYKGKSTDIEANSSQSFFELEIVTEMDQSLGKIAQYSGNSSNETAKSGGMYFRLRHLNTGRLVVMQEIPYESETITSVGLSEHLGVTIDSNLSRGKVRCVLTCTDEEYLDKLESNSIFRLISTGVDMDSGISAMTSVQIQHVASQRWFGQNPAYKLETVTTAPEPVQSNKIQQEEEPSEELDVPKGDGSSMGVEEHVLRADVRDYLKQLDNKLYSVIDEHYINQGQREMVLLEENASFENAFFIVPEHRDELKKVLFVHTSVNYLNNFLSEIAEPSFGQSRERQNKINGVLQEMIEWIQTDESQIGNVDDNKYVLDAPFSIKSNDNFSAVQKRIAYKQKVMRELRVIECLVEILHIPFACGAFNFTKMTQDMAILETCKLSYQLLSLIVKNYRLNELYASQWIGLFLRHILDTEENNQTGADAFMTQLIDENHIILEHQITTKIIEDFLKDCQRNPQTPRLIQLMKALCALKDGAIQKNQKDVVNCILDNEQERAKFLMPFRRLRRSKPIEICFDITKEEYVPLFEVTQRFNEIQANFQKMQEQDPDVQLNQEDRDFVDLYLLMLELMDLWAETCLFRNTYCQQRIATYFEGKILIPIFSDPEKLFNFQLRSRALRLYLNLHLDKDPFEFMLVPSGLAVFKDLPEIQMQGSELIAAIKQNTFEFPIKMSRVRIPLSMIEVKAFVDQFLKTPDGILDADNPERCNFILEVLKVIKFMLNHGFYQNMNEIKDVALPVLGLLNGANMIKKPSKVEELDADPDPEEIDMKSKERYFPESPDDITIQSKCLACDILLRISSLETEAKCTIFFAKLKQDILNSDQQNTAEVELSASNTQDLELFQTIAETKGFESVGEDQYICILFDLMLYRYSGLTQRVFQLLTNYFTRKRIFIENLYLTQILESSKSIKVMNTIKSLHVQLKKQQSEMQFWLQKHNSAGQEAKVQVAKIFEQLAAFCVAQEALPIKQDEEDDDPLASQSKSSFNRSKTIGTLAINEQKAKQEEFMIFDIDKNNAQPNIENQRVLQSFDVAEIALQIIKQRVDRQTNSNPYYNELIKACYRFLVAYTRSNFQNQLRIYDDVDVFMRDIEKHQIAGVLFYEIFKDNKKFLTLNVTKFLRTLNNSAEEVSLSETKKAMYLKLLEVFCRFGDKLVRSNQSEIILQMTADTTRSNVLYLFQAEGAKELGTHINSCLEVDINNVNQSGEKSAPKLASTKDLSHLLPDGEASMGTRKKMAQELEDFSQVGGLQKMSVPIFNVIQLLQLVTLCCSGKSDFAEKKCKESILNFRVAVNIINMSRDFWPLKIAVFNYITNAYMDSNDPNFMRKPENPETEEAEELTEEQLAATDVNVLLKCIEILNKDIEDHLAGKIRKTKLQYCNGRKVKMEKLNEEYLYIYGLDFIKATLKRKTYDVGSVELKFYVLVKNCAALFYHTNDKHNKLAAFELLNYIYSSERHAKYLDNVKHPAKKQKKDKEIEQLLRIKYLNAQQQNKKQGEGVEITKSNQLSSKILQLFNSAEMREIKEKEFCDLIEWVTSIDAKVEKIMSVQRGKMSAEQQRSAFQHVRYTNFLAALLRLLDARVLTKNLQITGLSLLRKIVEVENKEMSTPAADWDTDDWVHSKRIITLKQNSMIEIGTIQFLCKHISEVDDSEIQEECLLVLISLILGGNTYAQETFYDFMLNEDPENKFLLTIKQLLQRNFELTKKFMTEKNAKLDMIYKLKRKQAMKEEEKSRTIAKREQNQHQPTEKRSIFRCFKRNKVNQEEQNYFNLDDEAANLNRIEDEQEQEKSEENLLANEIEEDEKAEDEKQDNSSKPISIEQLEEGAKQKYLTTTIRILRFLQLLCEGHYANLQNMLREQITPSGIKNPRSFDFVAYVSQIMSIYVKSYVNCYSTVLGNQIIEALVEFIQGPCRKSQKTLVDTKSIDCCRDLLNQGMGNQSELEAKGFGGSRKNLLNDLKMNSVKLLLSILEGPVDYDISSRISASLGDFEIVLNRMERIYEQFLEEELNLPPDAPEWKVKQSLSRNCFDSCILEGFEIFSLLNQLAEILPEDRAKLEKQKDRNFYRFYSNNSGNIEINTEFDVLRIYFPIQPLCSYLPEKSKELFIQTAERESTQHKLICLCANLPGFEEEMDHLEIMSHAKIQITPQRLNYMRDFSTLMALLIGGVIISSYKYDFMPKDDGSILYTSNIDQLQSKLIFYLGCIQGITSFMLVVGFCVNKINLIVRAGWRQRVQENQLQMLVEMKELEKLRKEQLSELDVKEIGISACRMILQIEGPYSPVFYNEFTRQRNFGHISMLFEYYWISLSFLISNGEFIFTVMYFVFSMQGLFQSPVFYSFHLLDVINRVPDLQTIIKTVVKNQHQLKMTGMLTLITIYICIVMYFIFLSDDLWDPTISSSFVNRQGASVCQSLLNCFATGINYGLRFGGGMGDFMGGISAQDWNEANYYFRFVMDILFMLLISIILLNVVLGIIVDSFAQLREEAAAREDDIKNICFICGLDRYTLDRDTEEGYDYHTEKDHFLWNYVYFIIHLKSKDESDFNGVESYIYEQLEAEEMDWFPQHKSICLQKAQKLKQTDDHDGGEQDELKLQSEIDKIEQSLLKLEAHYKV